jgi:ABC-type proline/glycine betaine transport system ATPase subunit
MVLDAGKVVEYDTPDELLANENSIFYGMAKEAGVLDQHRQQQQQQQQHQQRRQQQQHQREQLDEEQED